MALNQRDRRFLARAVDLAETALEAGDEPFGSVLVGPDETVLFEDHNHVAGGDQTRHPEFAIARWAAEHLSVEQRAAAVVYTSGEHCPMCSAAHAWVGLGRIVYVASSRQLTDWLAALGVTGTPAVAAIPAGQVAPRVRVEGPVDELTEDVRALHVRYRRKPQAGASA